jgi:phenylalanyl-tRNA synthetase alpha chain
MGITMDELQAAAVEATGSIQAAATLEVLDAIRVAWLGKQGKLTEQLKLLGKLPPEERKATGERVNQIKALLSEAIDMRRDELEAAAYAARLASERIDVTMPGRNASRANLHPVTRTLDRITDIFGRLGYQLADGPEIEDDYHNFEALNFPENHPARAMHDTFYFPDGRLLRTHTSPVQIRCDEGTHAADPHHRAPARSIAPTRTRRTRRCSTRSKACWSTRLRTSPTSRAR